MDSTKHPSEKKKSEPENCCGKTANVIEQRKKSKVKKK